ncbi:MAG: beta-lactamase family protein [Clostridia bacterium]|nr:beta-lactamase family protein [Clostridia bacterium]
MYDTKALDAYLNHWAEKKNLAGVSACIMGPNGPEYTWNYGMRRADGTPVDSQTMFGIASMSKSMTALCLCILEADGVLSIDDPVSKYVPGFSLPGQPAEAVTLRHLMMHTSGLPPMEPLEWSIVMNSPGRDESDWSRKLRETAPNKMETIGEILDYIANCPHRMLAAPGEVMSYSNEGYAILSYAVDAAAGMPLEQMMQERIFAPLGMTRSILDNGYEAALALSGGNLTSLFEMNDGERTCDDAWSILPPFRGCAMVKSTAPDMAAYYRMIANYGMHEGVQAIPRRAVELLCGSAHPAQEINVMCCGLNKRVKAGHIFCEHSGGLHGVSTKGGLILGEGYGFSVLCNQGDEDMDELMWGMYNAVVGLPLEESHMWFIPQESPFSAPEMITGSYTSHEGVPSVFTLREEGGALLGERDGNAFTLTYCGGLRFMAVNPETGSMRYRVEFFIRDGHAWGVRCGTRVFERIR